MAGELSKNNESYNHFNEGFNTRVNPLTTVDKKILAFAVKAATQPALKTHGQILRNFGMYPPEYWTRAQNLSTHPDLEEGHRSELSKIFSRPGPMTGGAPIMGDKEFSHGVMW